MKKFLKFEILALFVVPLISVFLVIFATRYIVGVSPDSTAYISAADYLINHGELRSVIEGSQMEYLVHYPPGYSIILASVNFIFNDLYESARWINAVMIFGFLSVLGLVLKSRMSLLVIVLVQLFTMLNFPFFRIYTMAWSEPPYILLSILSIYFLYRFTEKKTPNVKWLYLSGVCVALALATRYIGVALLLTTSFLLLVSMPKQSILQRIKYALIHGLIGISTLVLWMIRNTVLAGSATDRHFRFHPMSQQYYEDWFLTTTDFFIGYEFSPSIKYVFGLELLILIVVIYLFVWIKKKNTLPFFLMSYGIIYFVFLVFSNSFLEFSPMYFRILSPAYIFFALAFFILLYSYIKEFVIAKIILFSFLGISILIHAKRTTDFVKNINGGQQLSSYSLAKPETIQALELIPPNVPIYSNCVDRIYFLTRGRTSDWLTTWTPEVEGPYYDALFKNSRTYETYLNDSKSLSFEVVYESDDLLLRKQVKQYEQ